MWGVNLSNPIGRLVLANTGNAAELSSYDVLGRPLRTYDCMPKNMADQTGCYTVDARYDVAGNLTSLTYPNGQRLSYSYAYDAWGNLLQKNVAIIVLRCCHLNGRIENYWEARRAS